MFAICLLAMCTLKDGKYRCEVIGWLVLVEYQNLKRTAV